MVGRQCSIIHNELGPLGQYIIYFFNRLDIRSEIIKNAIRKKKKDNLFCYFGTWYVEGNKNNLKFRSPYDKQLHPDLKNYSDVNDFMLKFKTSFQLKRKILFTVCYCYEDNRVHFVSFIYDSSKKSLYHFDPGYYLYREGQTILVPSIVNAFQNAGLIRKDTEEIGKQCPRYIYDLKENEIAVQYDGRDKDSYCQTWTLCFLVNEIQTYEKSIKKFCVINPENRSLYLYKQFIIPFLDSDQNNYLQEIIYNMKVDGYDNLKSPEKYLQLLKQQVSSCAKKREGKYRVKKTNKKKKATGKVVKKKATGKVVKKKATGKVVKKKATGKVVKKKATGKKAIEQIQKITQSTSKQQDNKFPLELKMKTPLL
jgi:hypothetical protein